MNAVMKRLPDEGLQHCRDKNHEKALECFCEIIDTYEGVPIKLFDRRASIYGTLGKFKEALQDAEHIIRTEKTLATGYLRAGQMLQKLHKDEKALQICRLGLRNVSPQSTGVKRLHGMCEKLTAKTAALRKVDPLLKLPLELSGTVLSYLSFRELVYILKSRPELFP